MEAAPEDGGGFFLDCPRALAPALVEKLNFYRLRAKVTVEDLSQALGVMALWDGSGDTEYGLCYADPRDPGLGTRVILPPQSQPGRRRCGASLTDADAYDTHRRARRAARRQRFLIW